MVESEHFSQKMVSAPRMPTTNIKANLKEHTLVFFFFVFRLELKSYNLLPT